ncbi:trafficking protein particle complex subunit 10-like protein, partial [Leptotrombidium deliense]
MDVTKPKITEKTQNIIKFYNFEKDVCILEAIKESIVRDIPQEGIEWHRSYGRTTKTVFLEASIIPFVDDCLNESPEKCQLFSEPLLHTFWMDCCDVDVYKTSIRDEMLAWINKLQKHSVNDWVVVVMESSDSKKGNKTKLLSRTSVVDKVKADFPQGLKNPAERCVIFSDATKNDAKSNELYQQFLQKIRALLSNACSRQLTKYEDHIRMQRENRNSSSWNFFDFFILQEELALAFEMLGLFDEALVQYDELDALFSQFVINSNLDEVPLWLRSLGDNCNVWHGLCLSKNVYIDLRGRIKNSESSLLDLRNYLFARQCDLLLLQNKPWEVATRSLPFLQNCVNELCTLEVCLVEGAVACWVFLSALEILQKCERYSDSSQMETYSRFTVGLWAYARKKLEELGHLAGLMPNMTHTSDCIIKVVALIAGMGQDPHS